MRHRFLSLFSLEKRTIRSCLSLCLFILGLLLLGFIFDYSLLQQSLSDKKKNEAQHPLSTTSAFIESDPQQLPPSRANNTKYIIVLGLRGLNNYILDMGNAGVIAKLVNRTLLVHPCVQNEHTNTQSFRYNYTEHRIIKNLKCKTSIDFQRLYKVNEGVPFEMVTESHPVWNYSDPINECGGGRGMPESEQVSRLVSCVNRNVSNPYVLFISGLFYLGTKSSFDFSEHVYRLVNTAFAHRKLNFQESMLVHVRLGDYENHCKYLNLLHSDCYVPLPDMEALLLQFQKKFKVKNVIVMTNGKPPQELLSRNNWIAVSEIIKELSVIVKEEPMDDNMRVVLEMSAGVLAKYFVGNRYSSVSGSIAALRGRYHTDFMNTTTSISALMGLRNETSYVNHLDYIKNNGLTDW